MTIRVHGRTPRTVPPVKAGTEANDNPHALAKARMVALSPLFAFAAIAGAFCMDQPAEAQKMARDILDIPAQLYKGFRQSQLP